jgi:hypothetical protein
MPQFPVPGRAGRELDESLLDMIACGQSLPPDYPQEMHALAEALADLAGPPEPGKLPGEAVARWAFTRRRASPAGVVVPAARPARRRQSRFSRLRSGRLAAVLVVAALGLGGTAAVYAGIAHHVIGAPAPHRARPPKPYPGRSGTGRPGHRTADRPKAPAAPVPVTPGQGKGHRKTHRTAPGGATPTCPYGTKASFRWHYSAGGSGGWSGTQSAVCPGSLAMGPQAMEGDLKVSPGTRLEVGYDFTVPGDHASFSLTVSTPRVVFAVACLSGATPSARTFTIAMPARAYRVTSDQWYPSGDQGSLLVYQGSIAVPDLCGGGQLRLDQGGTFTASVG